MRRGSAASDLRLALSDQFGRQRAVDVVLGDRRLFRGVRLDHAGRDRAVGDAVIGLRCALVGGADHCAASRAADCARNTLVERFANVEAALGSYRAARVLDHALQELGSSLGDGACSHATDRRSTELARHAADTELFEEGGCRGEGCGLDHVADRCVGLVVALRALLADATRLDGGLGRQADAGRRGDEHFRQRLDRGLEPELGALDDHRADTVGVFHVLPVRRAGNVGIGSAFQGSGAVGHRDVAGNGASNAVSATHGALRATLE